MAEEKKPSRFRRKQIGKGLRSRNFGRNRQEEPEEEEQNPETEEASVATEQIPEEDNAEEAHSDDEEATSEDDSEAKSSRRSRSNISKRGRRRRLGRNQTEDEESEPQIAKVSLDISDSEIIPSIPISERWEIFTLNLKTFFQDWTDFLAGEYHRINPEEKVQNFRDTSRPYVQTFFAALVFSLILVFCTGLGFIASYHLKPLVYATLDIFFQ